MLKLAAICAAFLIVLTGLINPSLLSLPFLADTKILFPPRSGSVKVRVPFPSVVNTCPFDPELGGKVKVYSFVKALEDFRRVLTLSVSLL